MSTGMPVRSDRIRRYVVAFCPHCHEEAPDRPLADVSRLSGYLAERDGKVWLERGCPVHGRITTLYEEDARILDWLEQWTAPTKQHRPDAVGNFDPVPLCYDRGLGELQTQHTCVLLEDITQRCNLRCPTCYASSGPGIHPFAQPDEVLRNVDARLARENGHLDVLMLSGGEPTLHPQLFELLDEAMSREISRVILNTNGLRVAHDDRLLDYLAKHRERVELYLQFDGFQPATYVALRGRDLSALKQQAVQRLSDAGVFTTLTMTAAQGINDHEIGAVVLHGLQTPYVGGVCIQPVFGSGRSTGINPMDRLTGTGVLRRLPEQTHGVVRWDDLIGLPCSHPHCTSVGYLVLTDSGEWRSLVALLGPDQLRKHLDLVSNRIVDPAVSRRLKPLVAESLRGLLSNQSSPDQDEFRQMFLTVAGGCDVGMSSLLRRAGSLVHNQRRLRDLLARRVKRITVKPFMDINTMIEERLLQCCTHVGTHDGAFEQCIPFCAAQAWQPLAQMKTATLAADW